MSNADWQEETRPEWLAANAEVKALAHEYADGHGFSAIPEAKVREVIARHGLDEDEALRKYGYWVEGGNRWDPDAKFKVGDRVFVKPRQRSHGIADVVKTFVCCVVAVLVAAYLSSCTPAQIASSPATATGLRIAACVQSVLAEEERAKLLERREAERQAEEEAEAIKEAAREHPPSVKQEIEKVLKDGAK